MLKPDLKSQVDMVCNAHDTC